MQADSRAGLGVNTRDPRYDILFEPVKIGPVTAKNRFYQVPHCNGGGYRDPSAAAEMRRVKSEGGWGVIFTEQVEIHHSSEITPFIELRIWDEDDLPGLAKMSDAIHSNGALAGEQGFSNAQLRDMIAMHADLPDIWDFAHGTWEACSGTSRFKPEGAQEDLIRGLKQLTPKPVVGVGRFTSADMMVRQVKQGLMDFIGAARPSIADPFLPKKIDENRIEDIRECIGCNICVTGDMTMSLSRCTQNSSFMEEWRKGWHPEKIKAKASDTRVLVVGAGPAGLSAAHKAGLRGYEVALAEAGAVDASCTYTGRVDKIGCDGVVMVTSRLPDDGLYLGLKEREAEWAGTGVVSVKVIGDANAPAAIAGSRGTGFADRSRASPAAAGRRWSHPARCGRGTNPRRDRGN